MATVRVVRADALARSGTAAPRHSPWGHVVRQEVEAGERAAFCLDGSDGPVSWTWSDLAGGVRRAAAGLLRTGLRADQVVLVLLPSAHRYPELDIALRAIGAVVVMVDDEVTADDIQMALEGVDVRLVVVESAAELDRVRHLRMPSARLLALRDDDGWQHLLALGAERLQMDPGAVDRADATVDPLVVTPRILRAGTAELVTTPVAPGLAGRLAVEGVVLLVGAAADPFVGAVRDAHLESGCTLVWIPDAMSLPRLADELRPSALVVSADEADAVVAALSVRLPAPRPRTRRAVRGSTGWWGGSVRAVISPDLTDAQGDALRERQIEPVLVMVGAPGTADLPVAPPVVVGEVRDLPRRSRQGVVAEFTLEVDRPEAPSVAAAPPADEEPHDVAVVLPSLSMISGESFLDKLLLARAAEARA